jgi:outer membrane lipoprotein-sorting protein
MKKPKDIRIKILNERKAGLQEQIKAIEENPDIPNKEFKITNLKNQIARIDARIKQLKQ